MTKRPKQQMLVRVDPDLKIRAKVAAAKTGTSLSQLVEDALRAYLGKGTVKA